MNLKLKHRKSANTHKLEIFDHCKGTALIELVLFAPILLFLIFALCDITLYFTDRSQVADSIRSSLNNDLTAMFSKNEELYEIGTLEQLLSEVSKEVNANSAQTLSKILWRINAQSVDEKFLLTTNIIEVEYASNTCEVTSFRVLSEYENVAGTLNIEKYPKAISKLKNNQDNLINLINDNVGESLCQQEVIMLTQSGNAIMSHGNKNYLILISATVLPRSISGNLLQSTFGGGLVINNQSVQTLKLNPMIWS